ncbi:MAG TPA: FG-GAP-like repeat-containing protein, partial [Myxococcales bacterium]|nr:FG-GAP-like repeat-containing protein [Myxococcales bacterium]
STNLFTDPATQLPQPYLALSSGYLAVLDPTTLQATNLGTSSQFPMPGMRTGGYYSGPSDVEPTPVVGSFSGSGSPSVVCEASNGALVRLDPGTSASVAQPPTPVWSLPGFTYPSLVDLNGDGSPEVLAREVDAGVVSAYGSDGKTLLWTASTPGGTYDLPFGDVNGDGVPDIFYEFDDQNAGMVLQMNVLDGRTGAALWNPTFSLPIAAGVSPLAVADMNGDGAADAVSATNHLLYLSGPTGSPLASNPDVLGYAEPLVANVLGGANPQAFLHGGAYAPRLDAADGGTIWVVDAGLAATAWTGRYGAIAPCDGGSVFIEGEYYSPVLHAFSAQTGAEAWRTTLSGGQGLSDPGSIPPGTYVGALGNVAVKEDLTGTGHMDALVGSTDGYLYAVQACNGGALDWAYDFGYPVGEPIVADTMGTGKDQVLVSVADGYLYALQQASIQPPGYVYAVDPPGGHPHDPVSTIDTVDTLYAEWSQVPGATGYQWAVYTSAGTLVGMTGYQTTGYTAGQLPDGGAVVDVTASSLPLVNEGRYYFAVRAVNAAGPSSDALSNTVEVLMPDGGVMTDAGPNDAGVKGGQDAGTTGDAGVPSCSLPDAGASQSPPHSCHGCGPGGPADVVEDLLGFLAALGFTRRQSRRGKHLTGQTARR